MTKKCSDCMHQQVQAESIKSYEYPLDAEGAAVYSVPPVARSTTYPHVERCRADGADNLRWGHPFGKNGRGPVLSCREMRLNECGAEGKLFKARVIVVSAPPMKRTQFGRQRAKE